MSEDRDAWHILILHEKPFGQHDSMSMAAREEGAYGVARTRSICGWMLFMAAPNITSCRPMMLHTIEFERRT